MVLENWVFFFFMWDRWNQPSLKMAMHGSACWELFRWQPLILDTGNIEKSLMNSQNKVIEIREQEREKQRDSKRQIKNGRGRESGRFRGAERMGLLKRGMKWYCSPLPSGSFCVFVKLCQIAEPNRVLWGRACVCICVYVEKIAGEKGRERKSIQKCEMQKFWRENNSSFCVCQRTTLIIIA